MRTVEKKAKTSEEAVEEALLELGAEEERSGSGNCA